MNKTNFFNYKASKITPKAKYCGPTVITICPDRVLSAARPKK